MENINYDENNFSAQDFLKQMAIAQQMQAMRPYKTRQDVFSSKSSTPYALEDILALRDRIGNASRDLDRDLAKRETFMYSLANALSQMPQQEGPGSWVSALGRGFGAGYTGRTNALVDRAQKRYQAEMKDIEERAALDKMMGDKETSSQSTNIGYEPMEAGTLGKTPGSKQGNDIGLIDYMALPDINPHELNVKAGVWDSNKYDPDNKDQGFGSRLGTMAIYGRDYGLDKARHTEEQKAYEDFESFAIKGMFDVLKALRPATDTDVLVALRTAGASPTMVPKTRDLRITAELNKNLIMGGYAPVNNLLHWYQAVQYLKKFRTWDPQAAKMYFEQTQNTTNQEQNTGSTQEQNDSKTFKSNGQTWQYVN